MTPVWPVEHKHTSDVWNFWEAVSFPLDFPFLSVCNMCVCAKSLQLCPTLCGPMDCSPPGSSVHGLSRQERWSGVPCPPPGDLPNLEIKPGSSTLQDDSLWSEPPGKPSVIWMPVNFNSLIPPPPIEKYTISIFTQLVRDFRHWRTRSLIPSHMLLLESGIPFRKHGSWDHLYNYCLPWEENGITLPILPEGLQGNVTVIILECPLPKFTNIHW